MTGNPALIEFIVDRIRRGGAVTFRWFMEQALYHPEHGYYASGKAATGRAGDFFTNVSVGPLFGRLLGMQFREMWERMGAPGDFAIVEQGANDGQFARDVLEALQVDSPEFARAARYMIVEPFPALEQRQRNMLAGFPRVEWRGSLENTGPFRGVHFSNELVDAMPVHLVKFAAGEWRERVVDWREGEFAWGDAPLSTERLSMHLEKLPRDTGENYTTEVNIAALEWIGTLATRMEAGYVLVADYGHPRAVYYAPERAGGTLACYSRHRRGDDPLRNIGLTDITAHAEFTSLAECAVSCGLRLAGYADQHHFMTGLGKDAFPDTDTPPDAARRKAMREFTTLMHPTFMGRNFKFLALEKNLPPGADAVTLAGFRFSQNPASLFAQYDA
ncbi:MAG TPA: SAM-dependent methyltransferase [Chthoniobacteraceae bacterium]|nr:SAM-dependent methyltransferase [Chthoniobacteraceae bacterium]